MYYALIIINSHILFIIRISVFRIIYRCARMDDINHTAPRRLRDSKGSGRNSACAKRFEKSRWQSRDARRCRRRLRSCIGGDREEEGKKRKRKNLRKYYVIFQCLLRRFCQIPRRLFILIARVDATNERNRKEMNTHPSARIVRIMQMEFERYIAAGIYTYIISFTLCRYKSVLVPALSPCSLTLSHGLFRVRFHRLPIPWQYFIFSLTRTLTVRGFRTLTNHKSTRFATFDLVRAFTI